VTEWKSPENAKELSLYRRWLLIAGSIYLFWWFAVEILLPGAFNPFVSRALVVTAFFAVWAASFALETARRWMSWLFSGCLWLLTLHYFYLFYKNGDDANWIIGTYITVTAISFGFFSARSLLAYSAFVILLSFGLIGEIPPLARSVFLPGLFTILLQANLGWRSRTALIKTLSDSNRRFQLLFDSTFEGVIVHEAGHVTDVNRAFLEKTGYAREDLVDQDALIIIPPHLRESAQRNMQVDDLLAHEIKIQCKDGSVMDAEARAKSFDYDHSSARLVTIQDISDRKRAEAERVAALTLAENVRIRDEFISIASHELKTPISSLKLQALIVERDLKKDATAYPAEKLQKVMDLFGSQVDRLTELVETMLDVSRISAGRLLLEIQEIDLRGLVGDVVANLQAHLRQPPPIIVDAPSAVILHGDRSRLRQVVENLISNAVKYGDGSPVQIQVRNEIGRATLVVKDQGLGIPADFRSRIFGRFERAVPSRNISGLGLGLYIAKQIVEAHGGTISFESEAGRTAFTVRLPFQPTSEKS